MNDNDIVREFGTVRLSVYQAGEWTDEQTGEKKTYEAGIKLTKGGYGIKLTAHDLAGLYQCIRTDEDVRKELDKRLTAEKAAIAGVKL